MLFLIMCLLAHGVVRTNSHMELNDFIFSHRPSLPSGHEEQYMYARNPKKEELVDEMLEETRQLALKVQEEAAKDDNFDINQIDSFIEKFQDAKCSLKRSAPAGCHSKSPKKFKEDKDVVKVCLLILMYYFGI